ncbi:MAG: hypothetical protein IPJ88_15550 [Myxococcales bacterium]|nr:MAG: hypothetical protein IPJ88_15550 [Myxococcales bacterium]
MEIHQMVAMAAMAADAQAHADLDLQRVQKEWSARVTAEYRSAALSAQSLHWLIQLGLSPDTIDLGHRIVRDELDHAADSFDVFQAAGGKQRSVLDPHTLHFKQAGKQPLPFQVLDVAASVFCCGETVAVPLFQAMLKQTTAKDARAALKRIVKDEAVHSAFGWSLLDELLELLKDQGRDF